MKPETKEINKIKILLAKMGVGSKKKMAIACGMKSPEISYMLNGGTVKDEKYLKIKQFVGLN